MALLMPSKSKGTHTHWGMQPVGPLPSSSTQLGPSSSSTQIDTRSVSSPYTSDSNKCKVTHPSFPSSSSPSKSKRQKQPDLSLNDVKVALDGLTDAIQVFQYPMDDPVDCYVAAMLQFLDDYNKSKEAGNTWLSQEEVLMMIKYLKGDKEAGEFYIKVLYNQDNNLKHVWVQNQLQSYRAQQATQS